MSGLDDRAAVLAVLERYRQGFASLDSDALESIWDHDVDDIVYVAQELDEPLRGWPAVQRYYRRVTGMLGGPATMEVAEPSVTVHGDTAVAFATFHFESSAGGNPHMVDGRASLVLLRRPSGWLVVHYHESARGSFPAVDA